jgi:hypothetical protein
MDLAMTHGQGGRAVAYTANNNPNAAQRLEIIRGLRLRGQAPMGAVMVATDKRDVELFEEIKRPVIEVWKRDAGKLDWTPIAGLWVYVVIRDWPHELRMELFDSIRAGQPLLLNWHATVKGRYESRIVGSMLLENGEPREMWVTPDTAAVEQDEREWKADVARGNRSRGWYSYGRV